MVSIVLLPRDEQILEPFSTPFFQYLYFVSLYVYTNYILQRLVMLMLSKKKKIVINRYPLYLVCVLVGHIGPFE